MTFFSLDYVRDVIHHSSKWQTGEIFLVKFFLLHTNSIKLIHNHYFHQNFKLSLYIDVHKNN
jgi:hypothetical protein